MPTVSIIVPVYNVKQYLDKSIQSILKQTYEDYEIVMVDDGSTDGCSELCDKYADIDERIHVFHKKNGGLASAVKYGIEQSQGRFLFFVDSDDEISPIALHTFMKIQEEYSADFVCARCISDRRLVMDNNETDVTVEKYMHEEIMQKVISTSQLGTTFVDNSRCAKLYNTAKVKDNIDLYNTEVRKGEDQMLTLPMLLTCKSIIVLPDFCPYFYRQRNTSICGKFDHQLWEKLLKQHEQITKIALRLSDRDVSMQLNESLIKAAFVTISSIQKLDDKISVYRRIISDVLYDQKLRDAFSNQNLKADGINKIILFAMQKRLVGCIALFEYLIHVRGEKNDT